MNNSLVLSLLPSVTFGKHKLNKLILRCGNSYYFRAGDIEKRFPFTVYSGATKELYIKITKRLSGAFETINTVNLETTTSGYFKTDYRFNYEKNHERITVEHIH